jgi:hypothetical protein
VLDVGAPTVASRCVAKRTKTTIEDNQRGQKPLNTEAEDLRRRVTRRQPVLDLVRAVVNCRLCELPIVL